MNSGSNANNNEKGVEVRTHDIPIADAMTEFMKEGWAPSPLTGITPHPSIPYIKLRKDKLSKQYVSKRLIFPSGSLKVRSNDSDYHLELTQPLVGSLELSHQIVFLIPYL